MGLFLFGFFRVEFKQMGDDFFLVSAEIDAVSRFDGAVEGLVGGEKVGGHEVRVVKFGKGRVGMVISGIEDGLRAGFDGLSLVV